MSRKFSQYGEYGCAACIMVMIIFIIAFNPIRMDFQSGSHRIIPTAMDTDIWGNYKVYYRTSNFTQNADEDYYYIEKGNTDISSQIQDAIINGYETIVFYEKYIGIKGFTAPKTSPIVRVEILDN